MESAHVNAHGNAHALIHIGVHMMKEKKIQYALQTTNICITNTFRKEHI